VKKFIVSVTLTIVIATCCAFGAKNISKAYFTDTTEKNITDVHIEKITFFDSQRQRIIPAAIYTKKGIEEKLYKGIIIVNHGYGQNNPDSYLQYSYLANQCALNGYYVVSIQHELPQDSLIPDSGIPQIVRKPFWERGSDNVHYVVTELRKSHPYLNVNNSTLIGHSNGGDIIALYGIKFPNTVKNIITLDNRRMALPKLENLRVLSLRSSDQQPDIGVIPSPHEQKLYNISIIALRDTPHNSMSDFANDNQRKEILKYVLSFIEDN